MTERAISEAGPRIARFSPDIQLGHILQAVAMLFVGVGIYFTVLGRLGEHDGKFQVHDTRLAAIETSITRVDEAQRSGIARVEEAQRTLATQIGAKLDNIIAQIADLRVQAARGGQHDPARR